MGDTTRQFLLNGADDELDGAVKRAIWRTRNDAMTGRVDSIHYQRAVVRDEVVPYEGHLWNRSSCRPNSRWAIDSVCTNFKNANF